MTRLKECAATLALFIFLTSCGNDPLKVDVSDVNIGTVTLHRLEDDLFGLDTGRIDESTKKLSAKYGSFYSTFIRGIINNGGIQDSSYSVRIRQFISDRDMRQAYEDCKKVHGDGEKVRMELEELFRHFRYYFPDRKLPQPVTMMSGFNYPVVKTDSTLAIGLEMYLGTDNEFYKMLGYPRYKSLFMNPENMMPDVARIWMLSEFPYHMDKSDFLSQIIYMGKIMYLTDAFLPELEDTMKIQYTQAQMDYCTQNEFNIWSYFAAQKLLYTTDQAEVMKYTSDGPFTAALSKESAPRIGYWIGWQIVRQYMKNNPKTTVPELMNLSDAQIFLARAKYKPSK